MLSIYQVFFLFPLHLNHVNPGNFGKPLGMGADCQGKQPWLKGWNFQTHTPASRDEEGLEV